MIKTVRKLEEANTQTHAGIFHTDKVFSSVILEKVLGDVYISRVFKVPEDMKDDIIVYDIGGGEFDHHQRGENGFRENGVPYASAGLIWKKYGDCIVADTADPKLVWELIDRDLIQGIDAVDNGAMPKAEYPAQNLSVSQIISGFNPNWDSTEESDEAFVKAVEFARSVFDNALANAKSKARAKKIVEDAIESADGAIMVLEKFVPWQEFIFSSGNKKAEEIQFVIFPSNRGGYNWQCVPDTLGGFGQRKPVPEEWKGLPSEKLKEVTGVANASFCHPAGFMGGAETLEDAIALARIAAAR